MVAFWKRFLWLLAVNAVINSAVLPELCVQVPKLFLRGVKTTLFRPPSKYYNSLRWPTNLEYFTNRRVESFRDSLQKWNTRPYTRSTYSEDLLEQSSMSNFKKATGKLSAKPNPNLKNFALNYALVLLHNRRLGYIFPDNAQIILGKN